MSDDQYDAVVIGAGSGGMASAKRMAGEGASVAVVEERTAGGTCVARGCMPKKFLVIASELAMDHEADGPRGFNSKGMDVTWSELIDHEQAIVDDLVDINRDGIEAYDSIDLIDGRGTFTESGTVRVNDRELWADTTVIATGLKPARPPIEGADLGQTSDEFLRDPTLPESVVIVGGGYIGVEFGSVLDAFGVDVEIIHRPETLIKQHDTDVAEALREQFERRGINVMTSTEVQGIEEARDGYCVSYEENGSSVDTTEADRVIMATGRRPNVSELGLDRVGVEQSDRGYIKVDDNFETSVDGIYAVGDINGSHQFTPVAIREGKTAANHALGKPATPPDYDTVPTAVFTHPEIGSVGLTERQANERYDDVTVATKTFTPYSATVKGTDEETFIKLLYEGEENRLIGLHVFGPSASELVQGFAVAMRKGTTMDDFRDFPGVHPTVAEEIFSTKPR